MTNRITTDDVAKVAKLARLRLTEDELAKFTGQLSDVLEHASDLQALDLEGIEALAQPVPLDNVVRADKPGELLNRDDVLAVAPDAEDGQYKVPPVLGEGG